MGDKRGEKNGLAEWWTKWKKVLQQKITWSNIWKADFCCIRKPIKSLGRWYNAELKDSEQVINNLAGMLSGLPQCLGSLGLSGDGVLSQS